MWIVLLVALGCFLPRASSDSNKQVARSFGPPPPSTPNHHAEFLWNCHMNQSSDGVIAASSKDNARKSRAVFRVK